MSEHGYGGFWIRFLASLIDSVIVVTALFALVFVVVTFIPSATPVMTVIYGFGPFLYFVVMHASERQATYGKALLGMVVTSTDGERISLLRSLGRELGKILSMLPLALGYVIAGFTEKKQALHDFVATTTVVRHDTGRVFLGVIIGVFGWLAPVAIIFFAGAGMFLSQLQNMNASVMQSAVGITGDSTASSDSSIVQVSNDSTVVQASMPPAARDTSRPMTAPTGSTATKTAAVAVAPDKPAAAVAPPSNPAPVTRRASTSQPVTRQPAVSALDPESVAALDQLSPRFAAEIALVPARFQNRPVQLYDFGAVPRGVDPARVFWPIHGFDASGNPVAIRGQRPIFTTIPRRGEYSGLWQLVYVVTADMAQPNALSDAAAVEAAVRARRATLRDAGLVLNLPLVPRGTTLARDTTRALPGWYKGWEVQFFDFGVATIAPNMGFAAPGDGSRDLVVLAGDPAAEIRNLQIAFVGDTATTRASSPLRAFADTRTPSRPGPTRSP